MSVKQGYAAGQFCWVDLLAHDMTSAKQFYGGLFGWACEDQDTQGGPPYAIFRLNGHQVAGMGQMQDEMKSQGIPPFWNSYINVEDVEATVAKAVELGGTLAMPPMQVLDAGWMAFIQDPTGGNVAVWKKNRHFGAELVNDVGSYCWNELATRDMDQAKEFYGQLFGWEYELNPNSPAPYFIIKNQGEMNGGIMAMDENWGDIPPCWTVYFTVADANDFSAKLQGLGGRVLHGPFDSPVGPIVICGDAQGAAFNAIQMNVPPD